MKIKLTIAGLVAAAGTLWWALAQAAPQPLDALFPAGAMLYLEARDFGALIRDWDASAEKRAWTQSSNYEVFSRSHLFLKLTAAQTEFATAAGVPPDYALLQNVAGGNSALAIYDIGKLEFLYITHLSSARALNTPLWRTRATYQTRRAGGIDYYVKQDEGTGRTAAFAYTGDLLLLATREDALSGALELIARGNRSAIVSEPWFTAAVQAAQAGTHDLRLVYNMDKLAASYQFRSHWIQRNVSELREFYSGLADLERATGELRERRVLLRTNPASDLTSAETPAGQLLALAPDTAGFYRVAARPSAAQVQAWIANRLFSKRAVSSARRILAPGLDAESDAGTDADLETRIDESVLTESEGSHAFDALEQRLAAGRLPAMLEVGGVAIEDGFVRPHSAIVVLAEQSWNAGLIEQALTSTASTVWSRSNLGAAWRTGANGIRELDGLGHLALAVDGNRLILSDSADLVNAILARRAQPAVAGASYSATWRHTRELPNYERMMRLIDFPEIRAVPEGTQREPLFFSENIASLGRAAGRVDSASITVHDVGTMLRESLVYRVAP